MAVSHDRTSPAGSRASSSAGVICRTAWQLSQRLARAMKRFRARGDKRSQELLAASAVNVASATFAGTSHKSSTQTSGPPAA